MEEAGGGIGGALVRLGFAARGVTYALIGGLAVALAAGAGTDGTVPNQQGALQLIGRSTLGDGALILIAVGLLAYALWKLLQAFRGSGPEGGGSPKTKDRIANGAGGIAYLGFFAVAVRVLAGSAGNPARQPRHATAGILGWTGGPLLVGLAGVVLIVISVVQAREAITGEFAEESKTGEMGRKQQRLFMSLGHAGLLARALVFVLIGWFLLRAAIDFDPRTAVGVDGALARLHKAPLGPELVGLAGVGLLVFAAFSLLEGRYRRL